MNISVKQIANGKWKENCYIVNALNKDALIIDPGNDGKRIVNFIGDNKLNVLAILNTHAHYDHVGAVKDLKDEFSVPFFLHSKDQKLLRTANLYMLVFDGSDPVSIPTVDYYFDQIETPIQLGDLSIEVLFTPGHTEGSVCFHIEDYLFTGDTLLNGNIGRIDLPGGDEPSLKKSLKIISKLPERIIVYPGHGKSTTLSCELKYNMSFIKAIQWAQ